MIWAATPTGSRRVIEVKPSTYSFAALPSMLRAAPAKKRRLSAHISSSSSTNAWRGLPASADSMSANSSPCSRIASASASSASERDRGVLEPQVSNASRAARTARSTSSALETGARPITSPVDGLITSS